MNLQNFLLEATRSFYVKGNRVIFTRGQEHISTDITRCGPRELAELIATICIVNAFADLSRKGNEPSTEEVAEEANLSAYDFGKEAARHALHMGKSDFIKIIKDLLPGLEDSAKLEEAMKVKTQEELLENELKMGRSVTWYNSKTDQIMTGNIVSLKRDCVKVTDTKFDTDEIFEVKLKDIRKVFYEKKGVLEQVWPQ